MKKLTVLFIVVLILMMVIPVAFASASVVIDKTSALPGETILISGTANPDESVMIKITDGSGSIIFFDAAKADGSGNYEVTFVVPSDMEAGTLTVTAGGGNDVSTTTMTVASPPASATPAPTASAAPTATASAAPTATASAAPTATASAAPTATASVAPTATASAAPTATASVAPTATVSAAPTATATASARSTATVTASATPTQSIAMSPSPASTGAVEPTPAQSVDEGQIIIIPKEISKDEDTGIVTIVIEIADLPEGTAAIKTSTGDIFYVPDAKDGVFVVEVEGDDVNIDGNIEITALSDEMTPLATLLVNAPDENEEANENEVTDERSGGGWIIALCIAAGLIILAAVLWILMKNRQK